MRITIRPGACNVFGPAIRLAREHSRQKITQDDLAARVTALGLPMDRTIVSRIENQKRAINDIELLYFSKALRINLERLTQLISQHPSLVPAYPDFAALDDEIEIKVAEE